MFPTLLSFQVFRVLFHFVSPLFQQIVAPPPSNAYLNARGLPLQRPAQALLPYKLRPRLQKIWRTMQNTK